MQNLYYWVYPTPQLMHKRLYRVPASPVHPCSTGPALRSLILYRGLIHGRSYRVSEAIPVHHCKTYVIEFILCCDWHTEHLTAYLCRTYTMQLILYRGLMSRKVWQGIWVQSSLSLISFIGLTYGVYPLWWLTRGRPHGVYEAIIVHPCRTDIMEFILYHGLTHGRSYRVSEASLVHPCKTCIVQLIIKRISMTCLNHGGVSEYTREGCTLWSLSYTVVLHTGDLTVYLTPVQYTVVGPTLWSLSYTVIWHTEDLTGYLRPVLYTLV